MIIFVFGFIFGFGVFVGFSKVMEGNLFGVKVWDLVIFLMVFVVIVVVVVFGFLLFFVWVS